MGSKSQPEVSPEFHDVIWARMRPHLSSSPFPDRKSKMAAANPEVGKNQSRCRGRRRIRSCEP